MEDDCINFKCSLKWECCNITCVLWTPRDQSKVSWFSRSVYTMKHHLEPYSKCMDCTVHWLPYKVKLSRRKHLWFLQLFNLPQIFSHESMVVLIGNISIQYKHTTMMVFLEWLFLPYAQIISLKVLPYLVTGLVYVCSTQMHAIQCTYNNQLLHDLCTYSLVYTTQYSYQHISANIHLAAS